MTESMNVGLFLRAQQYVAEAKKASKATGDIGKASQQTATQQAGMARSVTGSVRSMAALAAGSVAVAKGLQFAGDAISSYSNLEESINAVNVQFGAGADTILDFGETAATSVGLANSEFNQLSVTTGAIMSNFIADEQEAAQATVELTKRAADLASVFNTDVNEALVAMQAALRGEQEPIRRFGVSMDDMMVKQRAVADGLAATTGKVTQQDKQLARLSILYEQTSKVQGDFENTSDSLANRQKVLGARFEDVKAALGEALVPAMEAVLDLADASVPAIASFARGLSNFADRVVLEASRTRVAISDVVNLFDILGGPLINFPDIIHPGTEKRIQAVASAAINVRDALNSGLPEWKAYAAGIGEVFKESEISIVALDAYQERLNLTDLEMLNAITTLTTYGEGLGFSAEQMDTATLLAEHYRDSLSGVVPLVDALASRYPPAAEGAASLAAAHDTAGNSVRYSARMVKAMADRFPPADKALGTATAHAYNFESGLRAAASASRELATARAEATNPILRAVKAIQNVEEAQKKYNEVVAGGAERAGELEDATLELLGAQAEAEGAVASANDALGENAGAFYDTAEAAGIAKEDIDRVIERLDDIPTATQTTITVYVDYVVRGEVPPGVEDGYDDDDDDEINPGEGGPGPYAAKATAGAGVYASYTTNQTNIIVYNPATNDAYGDVNAALIMSGITETLEGGF